MKTIVSSVVVLLVAGRGGSRAGQAERRHDDRGSGVDRARGRRRSHRRRVDRARLSGSALRRGEAELHPEAAARRPARRRRPRARDRLAAAARSAEPQRAGSSRARTATSTRRCTRGFSTSRTGRSPARWATCTRSATRTTGSIRRTASAIAQRDRRQAVAAAAERPGRTSTSGSPTSSRRLDEAQKRWQAAMAPYKGTEGRHLPPLVPQLRRPLRPRRHRLRRAAAGHPADAAAHARSDQRDEAAEREAGAGRAVLRPEDAERDRPRRPARRCWCCRRRSAASRRSPTTSSCSTTTSTCWSNAIKQTGAK